MLFCLYIMVKQCSQNQQTTSLLGKLVHFGISWRNMLSTIFIKMSFRFWLTLKMLGWKSSWLFIDHCVFEGEHLSKHMKSTFTDRKEPYFSTGHSLGLTSWEQICNGNPWTQVWSSIQLKGEPAVCEPCCRLWELSFQHSKG